MRAARKLGKLSLEQQNRIMRRIQPRESSLSWERMMALRAQIEREIQPILQANREAEHECFQARFAKSEPRKAVVAPKAKKKPALVGYEYTPQWWKEAELRERAQRKAGVADE